MPRPCLSIIIPAAVVLLPPTSAQAGAQFAPGFTQQNVQIEVLQSDPDAAARREAARWLGLRGSVMAVSALANAAAFDPDRQVRIGAGDAIVLIRRRNVGNWLQK